jgi:hypothetical protein
MRAMLIGGDGNSERKQIQDLHQIPSPAAITYQSAGWQVLAIADRLIV